MMDWTNVLAGLITFGTVFLCASAGNILIKDRTKVKTKTATATGLSLVGCLLSIFVICPFIL